MHGEKFDRFDNPDYFEGFKKDKQLLKCLSDFLNLQSYQLIDALNIRLTDEGEFIDYSGKSRLYKKGYNQFQVLKSDGKSLRQINNPHFAIKDVQSSLLKIFRTIPKSRATQGGEPNTNAVLNARKHSRNKFMMVCDIANAFPSVDLERINGNLSKFLHNQIKLSYTHLNPTQRQQFIDTILLFVSLDNQLPQGAPTSTTLLNVIMAKTDQQILEYLAKAKFLHESVYTRFVDDITVSFRSFDPFQTNYQVLVSSVLQRFNNLATADFSSPENIELKLNELKNIIDQIDSSSMIFYYKNGELDRFKYVVDTIKKQINNLKYTISDYQNSYTDSLMKLLENCESSLDEFLENIRHLEDNNGMEIVKKDISKIITGKNGWKIKHEKTKLFYPNGSTVRQVTGVTIGHDGKFGISRKKFDNYVKIVELFATYESIDQIPKKFLDENGLLDPVSVAHTLNGIRNFIKDVKGSVPRVFEDKYKIAKRRIFGHVKGSGGSYGYSIVNGAIINEFR